MEFDFVSFFLGIAAGVGISYFVVYQLGKIVYNRLIQSVAEEQQTDSQRINLKVEKHGEMLYAFREDNDGFVCQGTDFKELKQEFIKRFPNQVGAIVGATDDLHKELIRQKQSLSK